jgi:hypothetical protein
MNIVLGKENFAFSVICVGLGMVLFLQFAIMTVIKTGYYNNGFPHFFQAEIKLYVNRLNSEESVLPFEYKE